MDILALIFHIFIFNIYISFFVYYFCYSFTKNLIYSLFDLMLDTVISFYLISALQQTFQRDIRVHIASNRFHCT